jgi:hypothetical protein
MSQALNDLAVQKELARLKPFERQLSPYIARPSDNLIRAKKNRESYRVANLLNGKDGIESEISAHLSKELPQPTMLPMGFAGAIAGVRQTAPIFSKYVPLEVLERDLNFSGGQSVGAALVGQNYTGKEVFPFLYARTVCLAAGARLVTGNKPTWKFPRMNQSATINWLPENTGMTDTTSTTFDGVGATYFRASAITVFSKKLLQQAAVDDFANRVVAEDLLNSISVAIDQACLVGSDANNQPTGILNMPISPSGYASVQQAVIGSPFSWSDATNLEYLNEQANIYRELNAPTGAFITSPRVKKILKNRPRSAGAVANFICESDDEGVDTMNGVPLLATTSLASGTFADYGVFSNRFSELTVLLCPAISLLVDPYTLASSFQTRIILDVLVSVVARHANSFVVTNQAIS